MYLKLTRNGTKRFLDLVESYRVPLGPDKGKVRQRHLYRFGELNGRLRRKLAGLQSGLNRVLSSPGRDRATTRSTSSERSLAKSPRQAAPESPGRELPWPAISSTSGPLRKRPVGMIRP